MKVKFKHFLILLSIFYFSISYFDIERNNAQFDYRKYYEYGEYDDSKLELDNRLEGLLDEFISDAEYYGYNTDFIFELNSITMGNLSPIYLDGEDLYLHGICFISDHDGIKVGNIILSEDLYYEDPYGFRLVFYHELGHWMGKDHLPHITTQEELLVLLDVLDSSKFIGIMHDGYNTNDSDYVKNLWIPLKHNFFVREMSIEKQKEYTYKVILDDINRSINNIEIINKPNRSNREEIILERLIKLRERFCKLSPTDMDGMFSF